VAEANGTPFGRYRLVELLGRGGMGEVWRAYDPAIDRVVALKVLHANFADDPVFQERFRREARAAAGLDEPHVVPIHDFGEIDGRLYVTMRLINGRDLQAILRDGPLSPERAVRIIEQVAKALHAAHKVGLVHRDIKPSNVLLDDDDFAYLIDFGIARAAGESGLTSTGATVGTWSYMAPERFQSGTADARADIYALACVLYEALTGQPPFAGGSLEQIAAAHMLQPPPRPSIRQPGISAPMDNVVATGMAKNPGQRYASTVELARAARDATTVPFAGPRPSVAMRPSSRPDVRTAGRFHGQDTQLAAPRVAPVPQPSPRPPPGSRLPQLIPTPKRPSWRPRIVIPAVAAVVVLIGGGIFAAVRVSQRHNHTPTTAAAPTTAPPPTTAPAPTANQFTGTYTADFGALTDLDGNPFAEKPSPPATETWGIRSACPPSGCVATAARRSGNTVLVSTLVFDDVGGRWLAVGTGPSTCGEAQQVFTLQPRLDGTLAGEYTSTSGACAAEKRSVTFTRTADVDVTSLPDPASQPPRVVSPAEALHGRYRLTQTFTNGNIYEHDYAVRTDCLRTGDRCTSYFHGPDGGLPLVFGAGKWTREVDFDSNCPAGGTTHVQAAEQYPLPAPPQDPIRLLTGHGHQEETGSACASTDYDARFVRTGD
jgi:serine/threonine-protein kinase